MPRLEVLRDCNAPPLAGAPLTTGSRVIVAQSECPFQALASVRWDAGPWPPPLTGLSAAERGTLVHEALAAFWRDVRTQARLLELVGTDALAARIDAAAAAAVGTLTAARRAELPAVVLAGEAQRLARTLRDWLVGVECARGRRSRCAASRATARSNCPGCACACASIASTRSATAVSR